MNIKDNIQIDNISKGKYGLWLKSVGCVRLCITWVNLEESDQIQVAMYNVRTNLQICSQCIC